jgi:uncharacterized iron-regulated membrane protein
MKLTPSSAVVKASLAGHSWVGVLTGALLYLVCLSGTVAVFSQELERWEQPAVIESASYDPAAIDTALASLAARAPELTEHVYVTLPSESMPRLTVSTEKEGWFVGADGSLGDSAGPDWTHLLLNLHIYLHLPSTVGLVLVSALGALLFGLILSGFLAHPRIFKDAFALRVRGSRQLEQTDIHNRLSVWGAPFHVVIALTGAYFGLVGPLLSVAASAYHHGDKEAAFASVFGDEPELDQEIGPPAVARSLQALETIAPRGKPILITIHGMRTPRQLVEIYAAQPGRLIYSENHRFDSRGAYLGKAGFSDGAIGRQIVYSTYRAHFGRFGGFPVKVAYGLFGFALTVVTVTGVNIWLARRKARDFVDDVWTGVVWGAPAALALTALTEVLFDVPSTALFWTALATSVCWALWRRDETRCARELRALSALLLGALLLGYGLEFGSAAASKAALGVNAVLAATALVMAALAREPGRYGEPPVCVGMLTAPEESPDAPSRASN